MLNSLFKYLAGDSGNTNNNNKPIFDRMPIKVDAPKKMAQKHPGSKPIVQPSKKSDICPTRLRLLNEKCGQKSASGLDWPMTLYSSISSR